MKNIYLKLRQNSKAMMLVMMTTFFAFAANAQTITINSVTAGPYYTFGDIEVDYTAAGYPAGTTFYLIVDTNSNGFLDAEDDNEDYVLASSTSLADILDGEIPNVTGTLDFLVVAGEDGTLGEVVSEFSEVVGSLTTSGTISVAYPLSMDQDMTVREIETPNYDLTSDDYYTLVLNVDATDVVPANDLVVEVSVDGGTYAPLTDQQGNASFSASNGELIFAISQTFNVADVSFRISQNNSATIAAATETWTLSSIDLIEYGGTLVQYNEQSAGSLLVNAPTFTINSETYDDFIGEDIEVDYSALGFTTGANFYLYNGDILDPENRTIFDTEVSVNGVFESTWPLGLGNQNVDVRIAGIYGNIDEPLMEFDNSDLSIVGSTSTNYNYNFSQAGVRSATTDLLDLSGEDYVTLSVTLDPNGTLSTDNAVLVQYSIDDTNWVDLEDDNGVDEITSTATIKYDYTLPNVAKTAATRIRVRQKAINLASNSSTWFLDDMSIAFYTEGADQFIDNPFVSNYIVEVTSIEDADDVVIADNVSITGGVVYPGDEITVTGEVSGFVVGTEEYTVLINNSYLLDNEDVAIDGVTDEIVITGNIPTNVEYVNASDIQIKIYDGTEPLVAVNENVFADYNEEEDITVEGDDMVEDGDTKVEFTLAGDRSLTTPEFQITSTDDLTLTFTLNRTNPVRSPSGTEVIVEYSTDGTSFTEIESFSINEAGESGETYELDNTVLSVGMASPTTSIRFRQASNNGLNLDAWELQNITLMGGTNVSDPGYIDYNGLTLDILEPAITFTAIDNANLDLYPSTDFDIEFEVEGEFPAGTTFELFMDREFDGTISFGDFTAAGTHSVTVPAVIADTYDLVIQASHEEVESNTVELVVGEVMITNVAITSPDAITDGSDEIVYPGNDIDITYDVVGSVGTGAVINLEIYDNATNEYMFIVEGEAIDGTLSATLPIGIDYNSNDAAFRLSITNGNLSVFDVSIDENWGNDQDAADLFFPVDLREGAYSSGLNYFLLQDGMRSATSIPLDFTGGGRVYIDLFTSWYDHDEDVFLEYSIDEGETWENLETGTITGNNVEVFPAFVDMPEDAWTNNVLVRFINSESYLASSLANGLRLRGFSVENFHLVPISEEEFTLQPDLILEELSVSQSTLEDADFILGEEFVVEYNAEGPFPSDVEFAIVLEQGGKYVTLAETDQTGAVQTTVNIPSFPFEDTNLAYNLEVIPFVKEGTTDVFRASAETETVMEEADILEIEGRATSSTGSSGYSDFRFNQSGNRSLLTRAFDLEDFGSAMLNFDFTWYDGDFSSQLTLPELQVSIDAGATFETLEVTDAMFEAEGLIYPSGSYSVEIPATYLTAETHFRWVQKLNLGLDEDNWRVYNIDVVKGETNELNDQIYTTFNNPQSINIMVPSIGNYIWEPSDATDAAFNGETFNYNWDFDPDALEESNFPAGTEYVFTIDEIDPETGENIVIGSTSVLGTGFEASVPLFVENGTYNVLLTATITDGDEEYLLFENQDVADLDVFLKAITANYLGDENAVIYAGSTVTFGIEVENDESTTSDFSTFNSNLILEYGGDDWLLASQTGIADISADLPPFVTGSSDFRIELSENGPIGEVGTILSESAIGELEDDEDNFISGDVDEFNDVTFNNSSGRGLVTTRDFEVGELDDALLFEFDIWFDQLPEDLTADQSIIFEFSTDGGATYTELGTFPEADAEMTLSNETFGFDVTSDMKTNATRLRWRQEEINGVFSVDDIGFTFADALPFDYVNTEIEIVDQALLISSIGSEEACNGADITINYEIRGRFGADNIVTVYYDSDFTGDDEIDGYEFNLVEGTGSIVVALPNDVLDEGDNNENFKFYLYADDDTYDGNNFTVDGPYSEQSVEYVAPIDSDAEFSVNDILGCESGEVIVDLDDFQNYFLYEIRDAATATVLGSLTYDPEIGDTEINIGAITTTVELELAITSNTSSGTVCNTVVSDFEKTVEILPNFELFLYNNDLGMYETVVSGDAITICEGNEDILLRPTRILEDGSFDYAGSNEIEWFKGDISTPFATGTGQVLDSEDDITESGSYFARITEGGCVYTTLAIQVTVVERPDKPVITVVSGDLEGCEGIDDVVLAAPTGFAYYLWSTGETTETITVGQTNTYTVQVSDFPFGTEGTCESESSTSIAVVRSNLPVLDITTTDDITTGRIGEGDTFTQCEGMTVYFHQDQATSSSLSTDLTIEIMRDGVSFASTQSDNYNLEESGNYSFTVRNEDLNVDCFNTSVSFDLTIVDQITDVPVLTSTGDLEFCTNEGSSVLLTAPAGFAVYNWFRNGSSISSNIAGFDATSNTLEVIENGTYSVQVGNVTNCYSPVSNIITVSTKPLPSVPSLSSGSQTDATCGPGPVTFVFNGDNLYSYQLINAMTGQASGNPVVGGDALNSYITSESISEETPFYMEVSYADGSGCTTFNEFSTFTGEPNNVSLELDRNTLEAVISDYSGFSEIRWYRNGTELKNRVNNTSISITDAATYSVEVDFEGVGLCTVTSNSIDLGTAPTGRGRISETSIDATTFPNPVVSSIKIKIEDESEGVFEVEVMTLSGQVVLADRFENEIGDEEHSISVNGLQSGIYTLTIRQGARITSKRLFIQ